MEYSKNVQDLIERAEVLAELGCLNIDHLNDIARAAFALGLDRAEAHFAKVIRQHPIYHVDSTEIVGTYGVES